MDDSVVSYASGMPDSGCVGRYTGEQGAQQVPGLFAQGPGFVAFGAKVAQEQHAPAPGDGPAVVAWYCSLSTSMAAASSSSPTAQRVACTVAPPWPQGPLNRRCFGSSSWRSSHSGWPSRLKWKRCSSSPVANGRSLAGRPSASTSQPRVRAPVSSSMVVVCKPREPSKAMVSWGRYSRIASLATSNRVCWPQATPWLSALYSFAATEVVRSAWPPSATEASMRSSSPLTRPPGGCSRYTWQQPVLPSG